MIPDPNAVSASITGAIAQQAGFLDALARAEEALVDASAALRATKEAMADLEDQAAAEALEEPGATNDAKRKAFATALLRTWQPYQDTRQQLADQQRQQAVCQAHVDDLTRRLKTHQNSLAALVALCEMCCHQEARAAVQVQLEEKRLYLRGCQEYRGGCEANLAARGVSRG